MATASRRTDPRVEHGVANALLAERPFEFDFFQAVRLLTRIFAQRQPVPSDAPPSEEVVRFHGDPSLLFPANSVRDVQVRDGMAHMSVSFLGLVGRQGVLPLHYTEALIDRRNRRDTAAADFYDLFLHRLVSFFYYAWEKHSIAVHYERELAGRETARNFRGLVFDLIGMGDERLRRQDPHLDEQALVFYSGLVGQRPRSASALEGMLGDYFQVPVRVEQFRGKWFSLDPEEFTDASDSQLRNRLGGGAALGDAVWNPQARIRLHLGPLDWRQYLQFLPGGAALPRLVALTRFFLDECADFDIQLYLLKTEVPECRLGEDRPDPLRLGLATWLKTAEFERDAADAILSARENVV